MKIRNRKTGEVVDLCEGFIGDVGCGEYIIVKPVACLNKEYRYDSWEKFVSEWEELEKPKKHWWIDGLGGVCCSNCEDVSESQREIGNYFESEEEADKALEELKVLKKLKDAGLEFDGWKYRADTAMGEMLTVTAYMDDMEGNEDALNTFFKGNK